MKIDLTCRHKTRIISPDGSLSFKTNKCLAEMNIVFEDPEKMELVCPACGHKRTRLKEALISIKIKGK